MSKKDSHPIRNGIIATVIGGIILSFWEPFRDFIVKVLFLLWDVFTDIVSWLSSTHSIYGWAVVLLTIFAIPFLIELIRLIFSKKELGPEDLYKSDYLFGANWHWKYSDNSISTLWCLCPTCNNELVYSEFIPNSLDYTHDGLSAKTDFICERCNNTPCSIKGNQYDALEAVKREIRRKIRNNEWNNEKNS